MFAKGYGVIPASLVLAIVLSGCGNTRHEESGEESDILMTYGDSTLKVSEVVSRIPVGLPEEDSVALFREIADSWLEDMVLTDVAEKNSQNLDRINRMVADYRNRLLLAEYMSNMISSGKLKVPEESVRRYYEKEGNGMILDQPLLKGIYIKVPDKAGRLSDLRRWMASGNASAVDNIEKYGLSDAVQYEYFGDRWVEWSSLAEKIPARIFQPDEYFGKNKDFEINFGGSVYILHVSDYLPAGNRMPYQYAAMKIREIIAAENLDKTREALLIDIYRKAIDEGRLTPGRYDPLEGKR